MNRVEALLPQLVEAAAADGYTAVVLIVARPLNELGWAVDIHRNVSKEIADDIFRGVASPIGGRRR